jgi:RNA recognition motif-containing protein
MKTKRHSLDGQSTGRFVVLSFDTDVIANTAMEAINLMVVTVGPKDEKKEIHIRAAPFIPNFRTYLENPKSNLVIYNIPAELNQSDLKELFTEFGKVLSTQVKKPNTSKAPVVPNPANPIKPATGFGYVLFEQQDEAEKAMEQANGKFLGPNQLFIQKYKSLRQRMDDNADVLVRSLPKEWTADDIKAFIANKMDLAIEEIFGANLVSCSIDNRPETVNSNG